MDNTGSFEIPASRGSKRSTRLSGLKRKNANEGEATTRKSPTARKLRVVQRRLSNAAERNTAKASSSTDATTSAPVATPTDSRTCVRAHPEQCTTLKCEESQPELTSGFPQLDGDAQDLGHFNKFMMHFQRKLSLLETAQRKLGCIHDNDFLPRIDSLCAARTEGARNSDLQESKIKLQRTEIEGLSNEVEQEKVRYRTVESELKVLRNEVASLRLDNSSILDRQKKLNYQRDALEVQVELLQKEMVKRENEMVKRESEIRETGRETHKLQLQALQKQREEDQTAWKKELSFNLGLLVKSGARRDALEIEKRALQDDLEASRKQLEQQEKMAIEYANTLNQVSAGLSRMKSLSQSDSSQAV